MVDAFIKAAEAKGHEVMRFDMSVMDGVRIPMERTAALLKWDVVGEVLVPGVFVEGEIYKIDGCAQAAALA